MIIVYKVTGTLCKTFFVDKLLSHLYNFIGRYSLELPT